MTQHSRFSAFKRRTLLSAAFMLLPIWAQATTTPFSPYTDLTLDVVWNDTYQTLEPVIGQDSSVQAYHMAFITDAGNCAPAFGGYSDYATSLAWGANTLNELRQSGKTYTLAFGGQVGNDLSKSCSVDALVTAYKAIISTYQPEGLDFDIENANVNLTTMMDALSQIQSSYPDLKLSFTLPVMPEGLTASNPADPNDYAGQTVIKDAAAKQLTYAVNIMAMDYGAAYNESMGDYAIQAAQSVKTFLHGIYPTKTDAELWAMIGVTPMIGVNDVATEVFSLENAAQLQSFADSNQLNFLSMWSLNRDHPCDTGLDSNHCSGKDVQTSDYAFSHAFAKQ